MARRAEVQRTDNSKLGRAVLNNRASQTKVKTPIVVAAAPKTKIKKTNKKSSSK